ncbi:uncharacterized protein DUF1264 [Brevibacterium sanguinis]|uniref:Uncharacterized protein DUF1264 n=2 Tax=Brevibacterium TaxID=1696 RepID=A0A366II72_9MICO|nr:uncharacterized protein DUF1264 [Brevibacterium sanguinis]RBP71553.1 uncharacterized protein DUF1264 [Brevibacterium celere]
MKRLLNSYGKTWHTWHTGRHDRPGEGHRLPLGDPMLMWSFNRDGECDPAIEHDREEAMDLDTSTTRAQRESLAAEAHPQEGVNALADAFSGSAALPGVVDVEDARP